MPPNGAGVYQVFAHQTATTSGQSLSMESPCLLSLILFQMQSEARPCSWGPCLCDGLPEKAPVSAALCLGFFNWGHMVHYFKKSALLVVC